MERQKHFMQNFGACALLIAIAFLAYANTFGNGWTYDDFPVIVENSDVRSWPGFLANNYPDRPLRELTYLLDHALFGLNPSGWHIQNIFWHGLNSGLLWILLVRLGATRMLAWVAALLFLTHPLQVEVVANISHRKDSLALAFVLLATLAYQKALFARARKQILLLLLTIACYLVGCMAKQVAFLLPVVLMAFEAGFMPREKRLLLRYPKIWILLSAIGSACLFAWFFGFGGQDLFTVSIVRPLIKFNFFEPVSPVIYYATTLASFSRMMFRVVWPVDLSPEYVFPVPASLADPWVLGGLVILILLIGGMVVTRRRSPLVFLGLAWGMIFWLPVSNVWPLAYLAADRYWYLPLAGLCVIAAKAIDVLPGARQPLKVLVVTGLCLIMVTLTWHQNKVWKSPEALWTQAVAVSPNSPFALNNLGASHFVKGDMVEAQKVFEKSFSVNPNNPTSIYNLGLIAKKNGDYKKSFYYHQLFLEKVKELNQ